MQTMSQINIYDIEAIWVWSLKHGYGVSTWHDGSQYEGNRANVKQHGKGLLINEKGINQERISENGKQHGFLIKAMQSFNSRFLRDSNELPNKTNEKSNRVLYSCPNTWKNWLLNCMRWWIKSRHRKLPPRFKSKMGPFISILSFNNFILASMQTFLLLPIQRNLFKILWSIILILASKKLSEDQITSISKELMLKYRKTPIQNI